MSHCYIARCGGLADGFTVFFVAVEDRGLVDGAFGHGLPVAGGDGGLDVLLPQDETTPSLRSANDPLYCRRHDGGVGVIIAGDRHCGHPGTVRKPRPLGPPPGGVDGGGFGAAVRLECHPNRAEKTLGAIAPHQYQYRVILRFCDRLPLRLGRGAEISTLTEAIG